MLYHNTTCLLLPCLLEERTQWQRERERLQSDVTELRSRLTQDRFFAILFSLQSLLEQNSVSLYSWRQMQHLFMKVR